MASTSAYNLASQLEAELICAVCQERYTMPRVLPCQHSFCETCLSMAHLAREHRGRLLPCPTCRAVAVLPDNGVLGFPVNFSLNNLVQILVQTETEVQSTPQEFCSIHDNKRITMYCLDCTVTTCSKCAVTSHASHNTDIIADIVETERAGVHSTFGELTSYLTESDSSVNAANEVLEKLTKQTEAAVHKIDIAIERAVEELGKRKTVLVSQLTALKTLQTEKIGQYKDDLKGRSQTAKNLKDTLDKLLKTKNDVAFLQGKSEVAPALKTLKEHTLIQQQKWISFVLAENINTQVACLDLGDIRMVDAEPADVDQVLNSRLNTARGLRANRRAAGGRQAGTSNTIATNRESDAESPFQINVERHQDDNHAFVIRYSTPQERRNRLQSSTRMRAIHQIGSCGTNLGDFFHPCGMALLSNGHLVIADQRNNRVQILEENGNFVQMFGNEGSGVREFRSPGDVATDQADNIYVLDTRNDRVQIFTPDGRFKKIVGSTGNARMQFNKPQSICISPAGEMVIADSGNNRIQIFHPDGRFSHMFGSDGTDEGQFMEPCGVAVRNEQLYVCDHHNHRIQVFRINGEFISSFGTFGSEHGQLSYPSSVVIDHNGSVVVSEYGNDRLSVFDGVGRFKLCFGEEGNDLGQFLSPNGLVTCKPDTERTSNAKFYVCDAWNHRLQMLEMLTL